MINNKKTDMPKQNTTIKCLVVIRADDGRQCLDARKTGT
jgi:hypothetical protein